MPKCVRPLLSTSVVGSNGYKRKAHDIDALAFFLTFFGIENKMNYKSLETPSYTFFYNSEGEIERIEWFENRSGSKPIKMMASAEKAAHPTKPH